MGVKEKKQLYILIITYIYGTRLLSLALRTDQRFHDFRHIKPLIPGKILGNKSMLEWLCLQAIVRELIRCNSNIHDVAVK